MTLDSDEIQKYIASLEKEIDGIKNEALKLTWAMRGGIQYTDFLNLSFKERKMVAKINKENLELTSKSGLPFF